MLERITQEQGFEESRLIWDSILEMGMETELILYLAPPEEEIEERFEEEEEQMLLLYEGEENHDNGESEDKTLYELQKEEREQEDRDCDKRVNDYDGNRA